MILPSSAQNKPYFSDLITSLRNTTKPKFWVKGIIFLSRGTYRNTVFWDYNLMKEVTFIIKCSMLNI